MKLETVSKVVQDGLCCACGICAGNCPKQCIDMKIEDGVVAPIIKEDVCIGCGICMKVCSVTSINEYDELSEELEDYILGQYERILCVKNKDSDVLKNSASGGVATGIIKTLLNGGAYDCAFLVFGYAYDTPIETQRFTATDSLEGTTRSRYLTVSHEHAVRYMLQHSDEKIILTGTGCAIQGLLNTIKMHHLHRENYLLIGLFCEKTMNYNVIRYFTEHDCGKGRKIKEFYFKHKEAGGWPGNVRIVYEDGTVCDLPNTERIKVKDYFSFERCLYCLDKLNRNADISIGDNYIKKNADSEGVGSVIIRTEIGRRIWDLCKDSFDYSADDREELLESQVISGKRKNYEYAKCKGLYVDQKLSSKAQKSLRFALKLIEIGKEEVVYEKVNKSINHNHIKGKMKRIVRRFIP